MSIGLKNKSQSLPRLNKIALKSKSHKLTQLLALQSNQALNARKNSIEQELNLNVPDPQSQRKKKINSILMKSKSMIQKNRQKIEIAKKFKILNKKSDDAFLTGLNLYKQQETDNEPNKSIQQIQDNKKSEQQLKKILNQKNDDLDQLRKMIKKTNKNLGAYKQQTLNIKKNLIHFVDRYGDVAIDILNRKKIYHQVYEFEYQI